MGHLNYIKKVLNNFKNVILDLGASTEVLTEGDIKVVPGDPRFNKNVNNKRNTRRNYAYLWRTKVVPYVIVEELGNVFVSCSVYSQCYE